MDNLLRKLGEQLSKETWFDTVGIVLFILAAIGCLIYLFWRF